MVSEKTNILCLAPHGDDELLGCGGFLLYARSKGATIHNVYFAVGEEDCSVNVRESEIVRFNALLSSTYDILHRGYDGRLADVGMKNAVSAIDACVDEHKPAILFIPCPSHHQDHKFVYDAAMASLRPRNGFSRVKDVFLYEYPALSPSLHFGGCRTYFDITAQIEDKIGALVGCYKSQCKDIPSVINADGVRRLASARGAESGYHFAEMYYQIRRLL